MAELAGPVECREVGAVPPFVHASFWNFRGGEPGPEEPSAAGQDKGAWLKLRDDDDYHRLAAQIVKSQAWKTQPANSGSKRKRAIGRLMGRALSGG
ncbi:hypothetical protein RLEG12_00040 (plasmid) [Rhizobium leguminosarum bv. trifolii CB782]|nr:hypothetical protein RLEG12_00040 [Rhizobium leguminosarum bv. trifolii CB782]